MNPFAQPSPLPYQAPAFDRIEDAHYQPAIEEAMGAHRAEIRAIADQTAPPTFDNTIVALERSGGSLTRATRVFYAMAKANTSDTLQRAEEALAPKLAAHDDEVHQDATLFARIEAVYADRSRLEGEARRLVERVYRSFVRAGARLEEPERGALRALNEEESSLGAAFERRLLAATKGGAVLSRDAAELAGLSDAELDIARHAAQARKLSGWLLPLQNTTQQPALERLRDGATRRRVFEASTLRAQRGDENDTRAIVQRLAELRAQKARLLGFTSYAAYVLDDQMAGTPDRAIEQLTSLVPSALAKAHAEAARMTALLGKTAEANAGEAGDCFELAPWDWPYGAELLRKAEYALDDEQVKPYLELDRVLYDGVFFAATELYGVSFVLRDDLPAYHPDVRIFEVFDARPSAAPLSGDRAEPGPTRAPLGLLYLDYFARDNKAGGAWMDCFVTQSKLLGARALVLNVCNFVKPAPGQPVLLTFDNVRTMFHEFGHALHGLFSNVTYPTLAGTSVPRDFAEFPSQLNEHWAFDPQVFAHFARHHRTGEPMPPDLLARAIRARKHDQGYKTTEYLAAALLDMAWHTLPDERSATREVDAFEAEALRRFGVDLRQVPPRYRTSYFAHIWGGGYAASYYAYLWSEVLDHDTYRWFAEHGGMTRENGQRFREMILSRGNTQDLASLYRAFRGRDPTPAALLEERGLSATAIA
jgi:peptidyl-dipeptidase Dcp